MHSRIESPEPAPLRIGPPPPPTPVLEALELSDVIGRVLQVDLIAALHGRRGSPLRIVAGGAP
jgi:hypothetical protein